MHCSAIGAIHRCLSFHYLIPFSLADIYLHTTAIGAIHWCLSFHFLIPFSLADVYVLTTAIGAVFFLEPSALNPPCQHQSTT
jgi:NADH:ubiquinone oxidoreductase subunit 6 (subunit J)